DAEAAEVQRAIISDYDNGGAGGAHRAHLANDVRLDVAKQRRTVAGDRASHQVCGGAAARPRPRTREKGNEEQQNDNGRADEQYAAEPAEKGRRASRYFAPAPVTTSFTIADQTST